MKLGYLAYRNMISKPWNLVLNLLLLVLSVSLVLFILQLTQQLNKQLDKNIAPVDMVVGAKGSPLQLVLSSVLHIDAPTGNIKLKDAKGLQKHPYVDYAIPVSYGDNYKGTRILGTELKYLEVYNATLDEGRFFEKSFEVVVGNSVAQKLNLKIGDVFESSHGLVASEMADSHDDNPYTVVGILKPTGTVIDQLLVSNLESVWEAHDHDHGDDDDHDHGDDDDHDHGDDDDHDHGDDHDHDHGDDDDHDHGDDDDHVHGDDDDHDHGDDDDHDHDHGDDDHDHDHGDDDHDHDHDHGDHDDHDDDLEITSLLVKFKNPIGLVQLPRNINENTNMQAALPSFEMQRLVGLLGVGVKTINSIAIAILFVSGLSIFISMLKTIRERRKELALLRTYGWSTGKLIVLVLLEGMFLAFIGFLLGWLLSRLALFVISNYLENAYGYILQLTGPETTEWYLLGITMGITSIAVLLASTSIFKLNISKILSNE